CRVGRLSRHALRVSILSCRRFCLGNGRRALAWQEGESRFCASNEEAGTFKRAQHSFVKTARRCVARCAPAELTVYNPRRRSQFASKTYRTSSRSQLIGRCFSDIGKDVTGGGNMP